MGTETYPVVEGALIEAKRRRSLLRQPRNLEEIAETAVPSLGLAKHKH